MEIETSQRGEVLEDEREAVRATSAPGRDSCCRHSSERVFFRAEHQRMRDPARTPQGSWLCTDGQREFGGNDGPRLRDELRRASQLFAAAGCRSERCAAVAVKAGPERKTPPGGNPSARYQRRSESGFDGVAALPVLAFSGRDSQPHFLTQRSADKAPQRMRLPAGRLEQFLDSSAARPLQQVEDQGGFAALTCVVLCAPGRFLLRV